MSISLSQRVKNKIKYSISITRYFSLTPSYIMTIKQQILDMCSVMINYVLIFLRVQKQIKIKNLNK